MGLDSGKITARFGSKCKLETPVNTGFSAPPEHEHPQVKAEILDFSLHFLKKTLDRGLFTFRLAVMLKLRGLQRYFCLLTPESRASDDTPS